MAEAIVDLAHQIRDALCDQRARRRGEVSARLLVTPEVP
jgi:hypothetical protein